MSAVIYPTTNWTATEQLVIAKGKGVYVYDEQGKEYLEGISGLWCAALGYGNEEIVDAATEQMRTLSYSHMFGGKTHRVGMALADKLSDIVPINNGKVFFGSSGSDANDTQVKMLRYYFDAIGQPEKYKIIARDRAYHGVTVAAASLTGLAINQNHFNLPVDALGVLRTDAPHYYRNALPGENETQFCDRLANNLEQMILREGPETIAAFIAEPVNGAGGVIVPPADYWPKIQAVLNRYGVMLIADEVITGFGRTGNDWGATTYDMAPKAMSLAKALSSAYALISAAVIDGELYDAMLPTSQKAGVFGHGYTYTGHPVSCAVALKTIEIYQRDNIFSQAATMGEYFQARLNELKQHPLVGEVRGVGMIAAVEMVANKETKAALPAAIGAYAQQVCQDNGLIVRALAGPSLAMCPPLIISREQIDELISKLQMALDAAQDYAGSKGFLE